MTHFVIRCSIDVADGIRRETSGIVMRHLRLRSGEKLENDWRDDITGYPQPFGGRTAAGLA